MVSQRARLYQTYFGSADAGEISPHIAEQLISADGRAAIITMQQNPEVHGSDMAFAGARTHPPTHMYNSLSVCYGSLTREWVGFLTDALAAGVAEHPGLTAGQARVPP